MGVTVPSADAAAHLQFPLNPKSDDPPREDPESDHPEDPYDHPEDQYDPDGAIADTFASLYRLFIHGSRDNSVVHVGNLNPRTKAKRKAPRAKRARKW